MRQQASPGGQGGQDVVVLPSGRDHGAALARLETLGERARGYLADSHAPNTRRAYAADWRAFAGWCADHGLADQARAPFTYSVTIDDRRDR